MAKKPTRTVGNLSELMPQTQSEERLSPVINAAADEAAPVEPMELWDELFEMQKRPGAAAKVTDRYIDKEFLHVNPFQPRLYISPKRVQKLKGSMDRHGQIQAALARPMKGRRGHFELAGGNRRLWAVQAGANAGLREEQPHLYIGKLRLDVRPMTDEEMLDVAHDENEEREDFSVFDRANYYVKVRELESKLAKDEGRLSLVINAQGRKKNRGAAQTKDGFLSWEEVVTIRKQKGKPLPPAPTIRRVVSVLGLPEALIFRLSEVNLAKEDVDTDKFEGVSEKHARAVLSMPTDELRLELVELIEKDKISGNVAMSRADKEVKRPEKEAKEQAQREEKARLEEEAQRLAQAALEASNARQGNASDADFKESDNALASSSHQNRAQNMGVSGVTSNAAASSGIGFITTSLEREDLKPADLNDDLVESELKPAVEAVAKAAKVLNDHAPFTTDAEERASLLIEALRQFTDSLANTLDYSRKVREFK